jgi:hypothetical protein
MPETVTATIGWSARQNAAEAGKQAADEALSQMNGRQSVWLALVFGSPWLDQLSLVGGVRYALGEIPLVGASTAGEIIPKGPASHSCVVVLLAAPEPVCGVGLGEHADETPREAGHRAAFAAAQDLGGAARSGFLFFGDGLITNYGEIVRGFQEVLGRSSLIVGALAGDELRFSMTYQYYHDLVVSRSVVGVLFGGPLKLGVGIEHGFAPISKPRRITRSHANVLIELDRKPAASVYEEYLGPELTQRMRAEGFTRQAIAYPLGIQREPTDPWLLRNVIAFGADGSLACNGEIIEGGWLQLMVGSRELALEAAARAAQQAIRTLNRVACVLIFDSVARRKLLGPQHAASEIARIREALGPSVPIAGCYTYGEQAPLGPTTYEGTTLRTGSVLAVALGT